VVLSLLRGASDVFSSASFASSSSTMLPACSASPRIFRSSSSASFAKLFIRRASRALPSSSIFALSMAKPSFVRLSSSAVRSAFAAASLASRSAAFASTSAVAFAAAERRFCSSASFFSDRSTHLFERSSFCFVWECSKVRSSASVSSARTCRSISWSASSCWMSFASASSSPAMWSSHSHFGLHMNLLHCSGQSFPCSILNHV